MPPALAYFSRVKRCDCWSITSATRPARARRFTCRCPGAGYLRSSRKVLEQITQFIRNENPDLIGLVEVDTGSIRTRMVNQAEYIADSLGPLHGL